MTEVIIWKGLRRTGIYIEYRTRRILVIMEKDKVEAKHVRNKRHALEELNDTIISAEYPCAVSQVLSEEFY